MPILMLIIILSLLPAVHAQQPVANLNGNEERMLAPVQSSEAAPLLDLHPVQADVDQFDVKDAPEGTQTLLKNLIVAILPEEFEDVDDWGSQKKVWDGLHMRMDGLELKTKRRWKQANHGTWKKHQIKLVEPDQFLRAKVSNIERESLGQMSFDLLLAAKLDLYGRLQEWQRGVRIVSVTAEATADVEIMAHIKVETRLDASTIPPGLAIRPHADSAEIRLLNFELHRISKAHGPLVHELGDGLEKVLRRELADRNGKIVERINRQFAKKEDDLKLSVQDLIKKKWLGLDDD